MGDQVDDPFLKDGRIHKETPNTPPDRGERPAPAPTTYCNPIALPNYPLGRKAREVTVGAPVPGDDWLWLVDRQQQFRGRAGIRRDVGGNRGT